MKNEWIRKSKFALLLVIIGFFMPISCNANGFITGKFFINSKAFWSGILVYMVFITTVISFLITVFHNDRTDGETLTTDWILLGLSIGSGVFVAYSNKAIAQFQFGAYLIILGWILSFIFLLKASFTK